MNVSVRWRLSGMMGLMYAVQGAWWPLLSVHLRDLGVGSEQRGWIFSTLALGSMAMPLGAGHLVDRLMATQRFLSLSFALSAVMLGVIALGWATQAGSLFCLFLVYWLLSAPSYALGNSLAFRHLSNPAEQFGGVRLWGTAGWMAIGWLVSLVLLCTGSSGVGRGAYEAFWIGTVLSILMALYSLTLPHTPPLSRSGPGLEFSSGLGVIVRRPEVAIYLSAVFGVSLTTPFVYQVMPNYLEAEGLSRPWIATAMTLGQWPEILALAVLPLLIRRIGYRGTLCLGITAWAVRYGSLALRPPLWLALAGIPLHGVGVACTVVCGQVFIDSRAPNDRRASVQALHTVVTSGMGSFLGSILAGHTLVRLGSDYPAVFLVPCLVNGVLLIYVYLSFRPSPSPEGWVAPPHVALPPVREGSRGAVVRVGNLATESADG